MMLITNDLNASTVAGLDELISLIGDVLETQTIEGVIYILSADAKVRSYDADIFALIELVRYPSQERAAEAFAAAIAKARQ